MFDVKTFTVDEANKLIPSLTPILDKIEGKHTELLHLQAQVDALELISGEGNGHESPNLEESEDLVNKMRRIDDEYQELVIKVENNGCYLKGVFPTLVDFYHTHKGDVVYLCWMHGEPKIEHWHEVGKGFADRHSLAELV